MSEPGAVVADLGENPCASERGQTREARDDLGIGRLQEQLFCFGCEVVACLADCVELARERECLPSHRLLDQGGLAKPALAKHLKQPVGLGVDAALVRLW
ncbi:hypothetical protein RM704_35950 [Streptomyces sp. DSM 3412]|uniref:4Fe-4S ferredoxin-type domain-containing protein n=1 Tax=Streptomyces gottesmaniae TaxID=3075518 RepID=A0ABU2Z8A3_9ACTN|nr:hypothetical protein [Streptomyces sp. DSM 3412]MDT0572797.1 hypothetical protein [Streptomyces sp. DSM 3412]